MTDARAMSSAQGARRRGRRIRIAVLIIASLLCLCRMAQAEGADEAGPSSSGHAGPLTRIQAHAGASALAPENTLAAFRAAKALGADGIETDVRMTKDRRLVLRHDDSIDRTSDGHGRISDMTLEELKACDFGAWYSPEYSGERILTLEECLQAAAELDFQVLNLELKPVAEDRVGFVRLAADAIAASGLTDRVMVSSFDVHLLRELKEYAPDIPVAVLTIPDLSVFSLFRLSDYLPEGKPLSGYTREDVGDIPDGVVFLLSVFGAKGDSKEEICLEVIKGIAAIAPDGASWEDVEALVREQGDIAGYLDSLDFPVEYLNCHTSSLSGELMEAMRERGIGVNVWTPDTEKELEKALSFRPEGIITNEPGMALGIRDRPEGTPEE